MITHPAAQGSDGDPAAAATKGPGDQPGKPPAVSPLLLLSLLEGPESALPSSLAGRSEQSQAAGPGGGPQLASAELGTRWPCGEISRCQDDKLPWAPRPCRGGGRWRYRSESEAIEYIEATQILRLHAARVKPCAQQGTASPTAAMAKAGDGPVLTTPQLRAALESKLPGVLERQFSGATEFSLSEVRPGRL